MPSRSLTSALHRRLASSPGSVARYRRPLSRSCIAAAHRRPASSPRVKDLLPAPGAIGPHPYPRPSPDIAAACCSPTAAPRLRVVVPLTSIPPNPSSYRPQTPNGARLQALLSSSHRSFHSYLHSRHCAARTYCNAHDAARFEHTYRHRTCLICSKSQPILAAACASAQWRPKLTLRP